MKSLWSSLAPALPCLVLATTALAAPGGDGFSYTYAELSGTTIDLDNETDDADQYGLRLSLGLPLNLYLVGDYTTADLDEPGTDRESDIVALGGGAHFGPLPGLDLLGEAQWLYNESDSSAGDEEDTGWTIYGGARWLALELSAFDLELFGGVRNTELERMIVAEDSLASLELGARAHVLFGSAGLTYAFLEDNDALTVDLRVSL
jgi:hypothetical protein